MEGRIPAPQRLGRHEWGSAGQCISAPDADGWREVLPLELVRGFGGAPPAWPTPTSLRHPSRYPTDLYGKCFNCLSTTHRVATCRLPPHCLRCKGSGTSHRTASSGGRSHSVPPMADHDALYRSLPRATGRMPRAAHRMRLGWGRARLQTCLVRPLAAVVGASDGGAVNVGPEGREVASRRQRVLPLTATTVRPGPPKPRQAPPRVRPRFASPCPTRLWRRCAWARALRHWSSPSTRC
jgi:hypothetical protein